MTIIWSGLDLEWAAPKHWSKYTTNIVCFVFWSKTDRSGGGGGRGRVFCLYGFGFECPFSIKHSKMPIKRKFFYYLPENENLKIISVYDQTATDVNKATKLTERKLNWRVNRT